MVNKLLQGAAAAALVLSLGAAGLAAETTTLKMATDSGAKGSPAGNALDRWAQLIEANSNGTLEVEIFYQNELGGQQELFDLFVANDVNLTLNWPMTSYDERISVIYTPYMVTSWEEALAAYRPGGWVNGMLDGIYNDLGLKFFGAWPEGFNGVATRGSYATTVEEASEMKIRVPPIFPMAETIQALGYQTATIDWGEVFSAIQNGVVDGDGANVIYWDYEYFRDTLDYYNRTKQQFITGILAMNLEAWESLTPDQQKIVQNAAVAVMEEGFQTAEAVDQSYVVKAEEAGMTYIEPNAEQIRALAEAVRGKVWPMMEERVGAEVMEVIRANATKL
ncbi:MAG: TRAP transporter substrate-binding protein DctP [Pseudomonadota bacterium]